MIEKGTSSEVAIVRERMTRSDTVVEDNNMVVELLSATGSQVVAALQEASIAGKVEVRAGTFLSGSVPSGPGVSGSRHINLSIYHNGNRAGDLAIGKSYQGSSVTPYAKFTRAP
jgi:hypothetical protein